MTNLLTKPVGSKPNILYKLGKYDTETHNSLSSFFPNLSAIGTTAYKSVSFLLQVLEPSATNENNFIDSFYSVKEICQQKPNLYMTSIKVGSSFKNILLDESIDIFIKKL